MQAYFFKGYEAVVLTVETIGLVSMDSKDVELNSPRGVREFSVATIKQ